MLVTMKLKKKIHKNIDSNKVIEICFLILLK